MIKNFVKSFSSLNLFILPVVNANDWQFGFQPPATSIMEGIISFHDDLMVFLTFILVSVMYVMAVCIFFFARTKKNNTSIRFNHASTLEVVWTIIPALILIIIAIPSFSLLYSMDEIIEPIFTIKVLGHQWYWSYELIESESLQAILSPFVSGANESLSFATSVGEAFDSYMIPEDELYTRDDLLSQIRLLTVDNHLFIPTEIPTRILVSSADVLHSWAVPTLGVKIDACPGRLNQTSLFIKHEGIFYGQCSEICGVNHGFMPIGIYSSDVTFSHPVFVLSTQLVSSADPVISGLSTFVSQQS
jgi:cytochrome c oxidase subunit 2